MLPSRNVDRFHQFSLLANLIIQLCLISRTVFAHKSCTEYFHNANNNRHVGLSRSEYFQMIRSLFVIPSNATSLESFQDLPFDLKKLFLNFTHSCSRINVSDCRNGAVDISSDPEEICKSISRLLNQRKSVFSHRKRKSSTFKISCKFVVSEQGILAADLVEGFDSHDDLISALDLTTIKAIDIIDDTSIAFQGISISLSEIFSIECPKDTIDMGDWHCQAVFAEVILSSISSIETSSFIQRRYEKALQEVINAGFLQEAISIVSNPKQTPFHVENFTQLSLREATKATREKLQTKQKASRMAIALAENVQPPIILNTKMKMKRLISTETLSNNSFYPRFVPSIFGLSNANGLTATNFCGNCSVYEQVQKSFDSLVALIYRNDDNIKLLETRILDVVDTSCVTKAPSDSSCQIVHASYIVNFTNYNSRVEKTFGTLASMTEESIDMGVFQNTLNSIYPDSPLMINSQLVAGLDDVQILNTFVIEVLQGFNALGMDSDVAKIIRNAYDALNLKVVENSNIVGLHYVSNSADLFQNTEFNCHGSAYSICCSILASYTVSIDSIRVNELDIQRRLSSLTESSIADGIFQDIVLSMNSTFPLVIKTNEKISGREIPTSQVVSVSTSFVLSTNASDSLSLLRNINIGFGAMIENLVNDVNDAEVFGRYQSLKLCNYSLSDVNVYICSSTKGDNECIDVKADFYVVYASSTIDAKRAVTYLKGLTDSLILRGALLESIYNQNPPHLLDIVQRRKLTIHPVDVHLEFSISSSSSVSIDEISTGLMHFVLNISDYFDFSAFLLEESVKIAQQSEVHCPVVGIQQKSSGLIINSVMTSNTGNNIKTKEKANEKSLVRGFRNLKRGFVNVPAKPQREFPFQESDMRIESVAKISKGLDSVERDISSIMHSLPETKSLPTLNKELSLETLENRMTASGNVTRLHNIFDRDQHLADPSYFQTRESDNSAAHIFLSSSGNDKGERKCFTIVTSFKSLPINTSLTAAQIQQYYLENMQSLISRKPSEFALNSDLSLKANGEKDFQRSRSNEVMISNTFTLASRRSFSYSFFQPGGSMHETLKIAFESLVDQVVGKSFFSYHPGNSRIDDVEQTSCEDVFYSDDCYVILASFTVSVNNKTLINDAKSQLSSFIERGISDGYFQHILESIDSESPLFVISDFEPAKSLAMRDQAPSGSSWPSGSPSFLPSLHGSSSASMKSMIPSGSSWPSDSPSLLPSLLGSNSASMNSIIPSGSSWPSDMPSSLPSEPGSNSASMNSFIPSSFSSDLPSLCPSCSASRMPSIILSTNASDTPSTLASVIPSLLPSSIPSLSPSGSDLPSEIPSQDTYLDGDDSMNSEEGQSSEGTSIGGTNLTDNNGTNVTTQNGTNLSEGASTRPSDNSKDKGSNGGTNNMTASKLAGIVVGSLGLLCLLIMLLTWRNRQKNRATGKERNNDEIGEAGSNQGFGEPDLENATNKGHQTSTQQTFSNRQRQKEEQDKVNGSDSYLDSSYSSYLGSESYSYDNSRRRN